MNQTPAPSRATLRIIRYAMLAGILVFGAVVAFLRSQGVLSDSGIDGERSPVAIALSVMILATIGAVPLFSRLIRAAEDPVRRFQLGIAALAVAEAAALAGGVLWLVSGTWTMYAVGLVLYLVAMIWVAPDAEAPGGP
jgi:hypothetical protein